MKLDVGCGEYPTGDVNVDRYRFVMARDRTHIRTKADIIADAEFLPFKDRSFDDVYSSHTIEHTNSPARFLGECERVGMSKITIICPSRWMRGNRGNPFHKWTMTRKWFVRLGYTTSLNYRLALTIAPFRVMLPNEIIAVKNLEKGLTDSACRREKVYPGVFCEL